MFKLKGALCSKFNAGPGGIECGCCRPRGCNKRDVKKLTARAERRKSRQKNWTE